MDYEAWLATFVFIGLGVTIGRAAVIGARSSVFKLLEEGKVYASTPLKFIINRIISE